jgi:predicted nucleotidyltransferase
VRKIRDVLSAFSEVEKAVLYGSRAKGNARAGSDIDLALFGPRLTQELLGQIDDALDDVMLPYRFDLSIFDRITQGSLVEHIHRVGIVFYDHAELRLESSPVNLNTEN